MQNVRFGNIVLVFANILETGWRTVISVRDNHLVFYYQCPNLASLAIRIFSPYGPPGGFGIRGIDGKIGALKYARENKLPALGLCLGLQSMVIEYSRHVLGIEDANSSEFEPDCSNPVIATMEEQKDIVAGHGDMGHTMRLGSYPAELEEDSLVAQLYGTTHVTERHRHRYEVNVAYKDLLREGGLRISGQSPDGELTEFVELPQDVHPFYVGTQAHPEFKSRPTKPHPLFAGLVKAALDHQEARQA